MTDLERRALLGDREAQDECTEKGIVLPCHCGGEARLFVNDGVKVICLKCGTQSKILVDSMTIKTNAIKSVIKSWNTRTAPPVGRCGTCSHQTSCKRWVYSCFTDDDYCSDYKPKEADENETKRSTSSLSQCQD